VSSAAITLCLAAQRLFIVVSVVIDSVRKLLDTLSYEMSGTYSMHGELQIRTTF